MYLRLITTQYRTPDLDLGHMYLRLIPTQYRTPDLGLVGQDCY